MPEALIEIAEEADIVDKKEDKKTNGFINISVETKIGLYLV